MRYSGSSSPMPQKSGVPVSPRLMSRAFFPVEAIWRARAAERELFPIPPAIPVIENVSGDSLFICLLLQLRCYEMLLLEPLYFGESTDTIIFFLKIMSKTLKFNKFLISPITEKANVDTKYYR